jgi:CRP-like cAMP-binding protein
MITISAADVADHPFLRGLPPAFAARLAACASVRSAPTGSRLFEEGGAADRFWLIASGHIALDVHRPGRQPLIIETIGEGELVGLSWLCPPPRLWQFGAMAIEPTTAFEMDADAVTALCAEHPELGYQLDRKLIAVLADRLHATRLRLLDLYCSPAYLATTSGRPA